MVLKSTDIQKPAPAQGRSGARHLTRQLAALCLHAGQHRLNGGRDGNREGLAGSALGAGESHHAVFQIDARQGDLGFTQPATGGQGDLKADPHPLRNGIHSKGTPDDFYLIIRKDRFYSFNRAALNPVIQQGNRIHLSKQSALAVNPLKYFQILARLVPSGLAAGRAWKALAPAQINFTISTRKRLQGNFLLSNKTSKMTPAVSVINFCERGNGMILDQILHPIAAAVFSLFVHPKSGGLLGCLGAVKRVVDSVTGAFCAPLAIWGFKSNKEPWTSFFNIRIGHGDSGNIYSV